MAGHREDPTNDGAASRTPDITGVWLHSYEEDTGSTAVYRPAEHPFRPSRRVRDGLEFRPDGTFAELRPGPDDRPRQTLGRWRDRGAGRVRITFPEGRGAPFDLVVLSCEDGVLTVVR
ncbi:hypothetical protein [Planomonospora sp. ID82291]|uniref:hypothetical protein n=1 Tax=Planomonospora sp. ID82291 TaxID=2738136 RepID=UPI0018C3D96B|nr:hypothetical protein [Planomonospora sp. ID82291]MBG0815671.1 hypothetical protein [Planomonospora sp. ID82291]